MTSDGHASRRPTGRPPFSHALAREDQLATLVAVVQPDRAAHLGHVMVQPKSRGLARRVPDDEGVAEPMELERRPVRSQLGHDRRRQVILDVGEQPRAQHGERDLLSGDGVELVAVPPVERLGGPDHGPTELRCPEGEADELVAHHRQAVPQPDGVLVAQEPHQVVELRSLTGGSAGVPVGLVAPTDHRRVEPDHLERLDVIHDLGQPDPHRTVPRGGGRRRPARRRRRHRPVRHRGARRATPCRRAPRKPPRRPAATVRRARRARRARVSARRGPRPAPRPPGAPPWSCPA